MKITLGFARYCVVVLTTGILFEPVKVVNHKLGGFVYLLKPAIL
jgi:hypothetical protein